MAQPSSSHRERERERERSSSSRRSRRTISSTTLLLVLSLVLAVLAVMLSLPSTQAGRNPAAAIPSEPGANPADNGGLLGYLSPKRTQALLARESNIAVREAEVARREAEILAGAPGGVIANQAPVVCPVCPTVVEKVTEPPPPIQTVIKEVVKEESLTPPGWWDQARIRAEDILDRELKIAEREREISRREEQVNRREHDASRRESWIMEQLMALNDDQPALEEEYVYEPAPPPRRNPKVPLFDALPPPLIVTETAYEMATEVRTVTHTQRYTVPTEVIAPPPASTRRAATPTPQMLSRSSSTTHIPRTTAVEVITEEPVIPEPEEETVAITRVSLKAPSDLRCDFDVSGLW
ncbi:hypothetical protein POSPLADRAFT_1065275 [Postia placenta MAD-698-R-SB12]|uniref:Uncharacterized protein n=1 Tax=Postia placenta MAD-698-R-SB12 TaxID=670580 RepID=A0A1X6NA49_9APHY|nr:hypothetical protein POSPLADRAFT_1065275 [Postia placenta MAD-698-R-SB12]OSX65528.1 hypothetical protein POSPLADRAFT_1065275 [Postia placenta MAD-698-R-SB12]